jgi:hypothetical protein
LAALESVPVSDEELVAATGIDFSVVDVVESDLSSDFFVVSTALGVDDVVLPRLSLMYQPLPLNTTPTGWKTRRTSPPHSGQIEIGASANFWTVSNS